ncbi:MAG: class I lanthipeptide [Hyphomicrobiales bacterium]
MKKRNLKLNFSKQTIANLDMEEMNGLNGGVNKTRWHDCTSIPSMCIEVMCNKTIDHPCNTMSSINPNNTLACLD